MNELERSINELQQLAPEKLELVSNFIYRLGEASRAARARALDRAYGCMNDEDGAAFERAIKQCRGNSALFEAGTHH